MTIVQLPEDIWRCVASFIPHLELISLLSVNKAFYNIILDGRYGEIHWDKLDRYTFKNLERLRTPSIARRVRRLHIRAWFIEYILQKDSLNSKSISWKAKLPWRTSKKPSTAHHLLASMTDAVRLMTNVTEYIFEWRDLPPTPETIRFLTTARSAFGISLRKLTLHARLDNFETLLSTADFDNLEELELFFDYEPTYTAGSNTGLLRDEIAPFVNHFRHSLSSLKISSGSHADLSPFFGALHPFPRLHRLALYLSFDTEHLSDPTGLVAVLRANAGSLSKVEIARTVAVEQNTWPQISSTLAADPAMLANLQKLRIPALGPEPSFSTTFSCIARSVDTLTNLYLADYLLLGSELSELMHLFAHRPLDAGLRELHVGLAVFSVEALNLFARCAPGLRKLYLVLPYETLKGRSGPFCRAFEGHSYDDWQLENIGVWEKRFIDTPISSMEEVRLMEHLGYRIPSVRYFKGEAPQYRVVCPGCQAD